MHIINIIKSLAFTIKCNSIDLLDRLLSSTELNFIQRSEQIILPVGICVQNAFFPDKSKKS